MEHTYTPPLLDLTDSDLPVDVRYQMIKSMLVEHECIVEFKKVSGETRTLPCTLRDDLLPAASRVISEDM